ncbi:hypothetical protein ACS0TY_024671 [Phlomoides rotata]
MGVEWLEIGVKVRKGVMFTIRGCFRSARNHPILVGILCFLIFLYRLSPFVFQLLVSASPILVCTAVLLGTILSFGQPNIPEIEVEEETTVEAASIKTGVLGESAVVEKNESYYVGRFSERSREERGESVEGKIGGEDSDDTAPLIEERSVETDGEIREGRREFGDLVYEQKADWIEERLGNGEILENHFASAVKVNDEVAESDDEKSDADSFGSEKVNVDPLDSPPHSPWRRVEEREDEVEEDGDGDGDGDGDDDDDDSDSGSSRAESSSPDASMADILPMLDELHPLLDEEAPQIIHDDFDVASEKSGRSSTSGHESDESENREDLEVADDDNEDEEDEEGKKEEEKKSAIAWTEEDEKNLMDLGSSEIERNQRLENLILRRRARKMFADKNLIDLDSADLPFDIAPISTRRHNNPFDHSHDYYDNSGLPPIPGSAPSVLLPRRNPFDIPYDSSEEKPDLLGDGFKEEFATSQPRESLFRRHESFNVGPSNFAPKRRDVKMRPFFVPEGSVSEESSSSIFQRQSSELSESKLSSVPDTESVSSVTSVEDPEDRKLSEEDNLPEVEVIAETKEEGPSGDSELIYQQEVGLEENVHRESEMISVIYQQEVELEENVHREPVISVMECVSEHVGHGSQSSEEEDSFELGHIENRDVEFIELESQLEEIADHSDYEAVEQRYTRNSSSSSLSEVSERVFTMTEGESLSMLGGGRDDVAEEPHISNETSIERTDLNISNLLVNEVLHRAPVYDTSPRELSNIVSSSSISCDVHPESDLGSLPVVDRTTASSFERESEVSSLAIETDIPSNVEMLPDPSVDESRPFDVDIREHDHINTEFSAVEESYIGEGSSAAAGIASHAILLDSPDKASVEEHLMEQHGWDEVPVSSSDTNIHSMVKSSEDQNLERLVSGDSPLEINEPPFEGQLRADLLVGVEETVLREPSFTHLNEVQASSTSIESYVDDQVTQKLNIPEVQELDHYISSNINSPSGPEFVAIPPNAFEATTSHVDERIVEEVDEIKEIDDVLLFELDSVGDFSIKHLRSDSVKFDTHIDSAGEANLSSLHETSPMRYFEAHSVEMNQTEDALHSKNLRDCVDMYEENMERNSELQTSETSRAETIGASRMEFSENDSQDSPYQETPGQETLSTENEFQHGLANHDYEDAFYMVSRHIEDVDAVPVEKADLTSVVTEIIGEDAKVSTQGQVDNDATSAMPELEPRTIEDIDLAFKQISSKEIEKPVVLEPPQDELHDSVATVSALPKLEVQSIQDVDADIEIPSGAQSLETNKIEDIDLTFAQISSNEIEKPAVSEPPQAELHNAIPESEVQSGEDVDAVLEKSELTFVGGAEVSSQEGQVGTETISGMPELEASTIRDIDLAFDQISSKEIEMPVVSESPQADLRDYEDIVSGMPASEVQSTGHVDVVLEKGESTSVETDTIMGGVEVFSQVQFDTDATSGMTEHETSTFEDITLAFEVISSKETEKTVVSEPHNHEDTVSLEKAECTSEVAENTVEGGEISCQTQLGMNTTSGTTELEARTMDDIDLTFEQISSKEITKPVVLDTPEAELAIGEAATENSEDHSDSTVTISVREAGQIKDATLDHVIDSGETQGASSDLHVAESIPSEDTTLPPTKVLDGETMNQLKVNQDDGSVAVDADKLPSVESQSPEKEEHECKSPGDSHSPSYVKGKGKVSKSSSSSSSSESSSSDSDKE